MAVLRAPEAAAFGARVKSSHIDQDQGLVALWQAVCAALPLHLRQTPGRTDELVKLTTSTGVALSVSEVHFQVSDNANGHGDAPAPAPATAANSQPMAWAGSKGPTSTAHLQPLLDTLLENEEEFASFVALALAEWTATMLALLRPPTHEENVSLAEKLPQAESFSDPGSGTREVAARLRVALVQLPRRGQAWDEATVFSSHGPAAIGCAAAAPTLACELVRSSAALSHPSRIVIKSPSAVTAGLKETMDVCIRAAGATATLLARCHADAAAAAVTGALLTELEPVLLAASHPMHDAAVEAAGAGIGSGIYAATLRRYLQRLPRTFLPHHALKPLWDAMSSEEDEAECERSPQAPRFGLGFRGLGDCLHLKAEGGTDWLRRSGPASNGYTLSLWLCVEKLPVAGDRPSTLPLLVLRRQGVKQELGQQPFVHDLNVSIQCQSGYLVAEQVVWQHGLKRQERCDPVRTSHRAEFTSCRLAGASWCHLLLTHHASGELACYLNGQLLESATMPYPPRHWDQGTLTLLASREMARKSPFDVVHKSQLPSSLEQGSDAEATSRTSARVLPNEVVASSNEAGAADADADDTPSSNFFQRMASVMGLSQRKRTRGVKGTEVSDVRLAEDVSDVRLAAHVDAKASTSEPTEMSSPRDANSYADAASPRSPSGLSSRHSSISGTDVPSSALHDNEPPPMPVADGEGEAADWPRACGLRWCMGTLRLLDVAMDPSEALLDFAGGPNGTSHRAQRRNSTGTVARVLKPSLLRAWRRNNGDDADLVSVLSGRPRFYFYWPRRLLFCYPASFCSRHYRWSHVLLPTFSSCAWPTF
jgi:hypothetical protein